MKYIILEDKGVIIFGGLITHSEMRNQFSDDKLIGAGMINCGQDALSIYGESISLDVKSKPEDQKRINLLIEQGF